MSQQRPAGQRPCLIVLLSAVGPWLERAAGGKAAGGLGCLSDVWSHDGVPNLGVYSERWPAMWSIVHFVVVWAFLPNPIKAFLPQPAPELCMFSGKGQSLWGSLEVNMDPTRVAWLWAQ